MIYAAITYTLLTLLYTVVNIPYCALGGVITNDPTQRISLQSWRFVLATAGGMLSTVLMMPLVNLIGGEDKALGFEGRDCRALGCGVPDAGVLLLYYQRTCGSAAEQQLNA